MRQQCAKVKVVSQAYVSQILNKQRNLNKKNLPLLAEVFNLKPEERRLLEKKLPPRTEAPDEDSVEVAAKKIPGVKTDNHILRHWSYPYVKDLILLKGFSPEPARLGKMLGGLISEVHIKKAIQYLLAQGFWRSSLGGQVVPAESSIATTTDIPSINIRKFHQKALHFAQQGIEKISPQDRKASTILVSIDDEQLQELRELMDHVEDQIIAFTQKYPAGSDKLMQITMHLTPLGASYEK